MMIHAMPALRKPPDRPPADRRVRALFDDDTIVVYQAFGHQIADAALAAGTFVAPFKRDRMTWIKPSFLWMMYRSGWATKAGQERVLAVTMTRAGLEAALLGACLSHFDANVHTSERDWIERKESSPVRVQWDPDRSLRLERLDDRAIQVGLAGDALHRYVEDWIVAIEDVTPAAHEMCRLVTAGDLAAARALLPDARPYPLPAEIGSLVGAT